MYLDVSVAATAQVARVFLLLSLALGAGVLGPGCKSESREETGSGEGIDKREEARKETPEECRQRCEELMTRHKEQVNSRCKEQFAAAEKAQKAYDEASAEWSAALDAQLGQIQGGSLTADLKGMNSAQLAAFSQGWEQGNRRAGASEAKLKALGVEMEAAMQSAVECTNSVTPSRAEAESCSSKCL